MEENKIPEVTAEETAETEAEEIKEIAEETEETVAEETEAVEEAAAEDAAEVVEEAEADNVENAAEAEATAQIGETQPAEAPAKKKRVLQIPVIICICIVVAALLGYFVFTGFFLREPEGVTWTSEQDGATYYYEFNNDGTFNAYVGSVEINSTYQKTKSADGNTLTVGATIGNFYSNVAATYDISGSRWLGDQKMNCSYGDEYSFTVSQTTRKDLSLELPKDFTPNEELLGSWVFRYMGYDIYRVTFNDNGSMTLEFVQDGIKYNGTYTIEGNTVNFTYYVAESYATPLEFSVDGDKLTFMGYEFVREGSAAAEATPDQQLILSGQ